jgi:hypothetical protein
VIGRHLFDITNGWEGSPPAGDHVVVVSRRRDENMQQHYLDLFTASGGASPSCVHAEGPDLS